MCQYINRNLYCSLITFDYEKEEFYTLKYYILTQTIYGQCVCITTTIYTGTIECVTMLVSAFKGVTYLPTRIRRITIYIAT